MRGCRDVLGMWIGENESAKFWLSVINDMKNRGVQDILIACVDELTGFPNAVFSKDKAAALHYTPNSKHHSIYILQGY